MDEREYLERLARDAAGWRREGLITPEQERAILAREGAGRPSAIRVLRLGWLITAVSIIGAVVLGAGVALFFSANWNDMPDAFRAALIFASILVSYTIAYAFMYRYNLQRIGSAFLLLGAILYQAGLFLLSQIYSMPVNSPQLWLLGAIGIAPLAYLFESRIVLLGAMGATAAWVVSEIATRYPDSPEAQTSLIMIGAYGIALYALGRLHNLWPQLLRYVDVYSFVGLFLMLALHYQFGLDALWDEITDAGVESYTAPTFVYAFIGVAAVLTAAQRLLRGRSLEADIETAVAAGLLLLWGVVATWPAWTGYALIFNVVFFALAGALVAKGYMQGDERYVNFGLAAVAVGLVTRYIDLFVELLPASLFFMVGGALLLGLAFGLERLRRGLIRGMGESESSADAPPAQEATT